MSAKYHWRESEGAACGRRVATYGEAFFFDDDGPYFTDATGRRVESCPRCLRLAIGAAVVAHNAATQGEITHAANPDRSPKSSQTSPRGNPHNPGDISHRLRHTVRTIESLPLWGRAVKAG